MSRSLPGAVVTSRWLQTEPMPMEPKLRLICLPHAGGGASFFRGWQASLPLGVQLCRVQPPGRENRIGEPPYCQMEVLVAELVAQLLPWLDRPFALFGHSMGAIVAYELARALQERGRLAEHLWVSACRPPHILDRQPIHGLPRTEFLAALAARGGTPASILANADYMGMVEPLLRADLALIERWQRHGIETLRCPMTGLAALDDGVTPVAAVEAWRSYTEAAFTLRHFRGGHFYLTDLAHRVPALVGATLAEYMNPENVT